jgi:cytochrome oxidase assembly protein ShyY1
VAPGRRIGARWIVGSVLVAAICFGCIEAGFWQIRRLHERQALNARIRERSADTVPLPEVDDGTEPDDLVYRRVDVAGTYDATHEVLVRFRSRTGLPGYEVLTPLRTDDGPTVLVDRGWVPLEDGDRWPVPEMAPHPDQVEVTGLLAPAEGGSTRLARRPDGVQVVNAIDPATLRAAVDDGDLYPVYLLADDGGSGVGSSFPVPVDPPALTEGPHRSYAVQWFLFASVGIVGWAALLRRRGPLAPQPARSESMASSTDDDLST